MFGVHDATFANQCLRRHKACTGVYSRLVDLGVRRKAKYSSSAERVWSWPIADKFVHRNRQPVRPPCPRRQEHPSLRRRANAARFRLYRRRSVGRTSVLAHNCDVGDCLDVGAGRSVTIRSVGEFMARRYGAPSPHVTGTYRHGDIRHASCDISATVQELNWRPQWTLESGLEALCGWIDRRLTPTLRTASSANIA